MALEILAVGTGRDGTVSIAHLIREIYKRHDIEGTVGHEYAAQAFYNAFCALKTTGDQKYRDELRRLVADCPHRAIVGNGYAGVLDLFAEIWPGVKLIHVKRRDREALIRSHMSNQQFFPETYLNYGSETGVMERTAAFHLGEMSREAWEVLSLHDRFGWFYDYTHAELDRAKPSFSSVLEVFTEDLSRPETLKSLNQFVGGGETAPPPPLALNRHVYAAITDFTDQNRAFGQWLFGRLDMAKLQDDPLYLSEYATNAFITWMGYLISGFASQLNETYVADDQTIRQTVENFADLLRRRSWEANLLLHELNLKHAARTKADQNQDA